MKYLNLLKSTVISMVLCLTAWIANANHLQIQNVTVISNTQISFQVAWENAWNIQQAPANHDAVWIFIKYKKNNDAWQHLHLSSQTAQHWAENPLIVDAVPDEKGVFVKKNTLGNSHIPFTNITLKIATPLEPAHYRFKVFGIEMVYIPQGSFYVGDSASINRLGTFPSFAPFLIQNEDSILVGNTAGRLSSAGLYTPAAHIPATFPKGFQAFYTMKYEITQQQYSDFLNCLTLEQQTNRTANSPHSAVGTLALSQSGSFRNGIRIKQVASGNMPAVYGCDANHNGIFDEIDDGQNRACNFLNWADLTAYLDWAALRPMTELEFEKICRGNLLPIAGELAFGTPFATDANTLLLDGTPQETVTEQVSGNVGLASFGYAGPQGGLRVGFAAKANSNRLSAGAAYFGVMEMSGNLWEQTVCVCTTEGLQFTAALGDGALSETGNANTDTWGNTMTAEAGGYRGGAWLSGFFAVGQFRDVAISDRFYAGLLPTLRRNTSGGRGVR
jgi:formylglycine-generating enzyme required for sulfatase activity